MRTMQAIEEELTALAKDRCTSFVASNLIRTWMERDCVDAANELRVIANLFDERAHAINEHMLCNGHMRTRAI